MIGFSASFAKTFSKIISDLESSLDKYVFSTILTAIADGDCEIYIGLNREEANYCSKILKYNGFIVEDLCPNEDSTQLIISW